LALNFLAGYQFIFDQFFSKLIVPFCTHEESVLGRSEMDIKKFCSEVTVVSGLVMHVTSTYLVNPKVKE